MKLHIQVTCLVLILQFVSCYNKSPKETRPKTTTTATSVNITEDHLSNIKASKNKHAFRPSTRDPENILVDVLGLFKWGALKEADASSSITDDMYNNHQLGDMFNNDYVFLEDIRRPAEHFERGDVKVPNGKFKRARSDSKTFTVNSARQLNEPYGRFLDYTVSPETSNYVANTNTEHKKQKADTPSINRDIVNTENTNYEAKHLPEVTKRNNNNEWCTVDATQMSLTFSENFETGNGVVVLVCQGNALVNKCEGVCNSTVMPNVNHYDGYKKECSCCRDASTRQRDITLRSCSIDSREVTGHFLTRTIVEPATCSCLECRS